MFRQLLTAEVAAASPQPAPSVTLDAAKISNGDTIVMWHGVNTNPANMAALPAGWTLDFIAPRSTFQGFRGAHRTWSTGDSLVVSTSTTVANVIQELLVFVLPGTATFDKLDLSEVTGATSIVHGPTATLGANTKLVMAAARTTAVSGGFGAAPAGYEETWESANGRFQVIHKFEAATTDPQSATQSWATSGGAAGAVASYLFTPLAPPVATMSWAHEMPLFTGNTDTPEDLVKLPQPMFARQFGAFMSDFSAGTGMVQTTWNRIASYYRYLHPEGHDHSRLLRNEPDALSAMEKFVAGGGPLHFCDIYTNGSYVTQAPPANPWLPMRPAAHAERHHPLGLAVLNTLTPMTVSGALSSTATTVSFNLPTTKATGLAATHPSGTPSTFWPLVASKAAPAMDRFSTTTADYVSWVRVDDEIIGLPTYSGGGGGGTSPQEPTGPNPSPQVATFTTRADRQLTTAQGETIYVRYPTTGGVMASARPVVYVGHGQGMGSNMPTVMNGANFLNNAGYVTIAANIDPPSGYLNKARLVSRAIDALLADTVMAPGILPNRIGYFGGSQGAITGIALQDPSVRDNRIRAFVLRSPMNIGASPSYADAMPILVMLGTADTTIPPATSRAIYDAMTSPKGKIELPGAGHDMVEPTPSSIVQDASKALFSRFLLGVSTGWPANMQTAVDNDPNNPPYVSDWTLDPGTGGGGGSTNWTLNAAGTVATVSGVVRGLWRTPRQAHAAGARVRTPDYIGSDTAAAADKPLSGNPIADSTGGLRYALAYYDQALGGTKDGLQPIADLISMELQGIHLGALKTVSAVSADGTHTSTAHGFTNGQRVAFGGSNMPGGTRSWTPYFIRDAAANTFKIARTSGGKALDVNAPPREWAFGTWVLQQFNSLTQFNQLSGDVAAVLALPGITGFSMRMPWDAWEQYPDLINQGKALADAAGKKFMFRFMAGEHTPARIFTAGAYSYQSNLGTATQPRMASIPKGFSDAGVAGNPVFEREFEAAVSRLAAWCRDNDSRLMHLAWYGWKWSEYMNGPDVIAAAGYSWANQLASSRRLAEIAKKYSGDDLAVEFAVSGHYDDPAVNEYNEITAMLSDLFGYDSPALITSANNMSDQESTMGAPAPALRLNHAKQSVSSTINNYDWAAVYAAATTRNWAYIEWYLPQFTGGTSATLKSQAAAWAAAHTYTPPAITDYKAARLLRLPSQPISNGVELDVSAGIYNNAGAYGEPIEQASSAFEGKPYSYAEGGTQKDTPARQREKRVPLQGKLTNLGHPSTVKLTANNFLGGAGQGTVRLDMVAGNEYDGYLLEHATMEPSNMVAHLTQYCQMHAGVNGAGTVVNPGGHKSIQWAKFGDWKGGAYSAANGSAYLRMNYAAWMLTWRTTSVNPILSGKWHNTSLGDRPSDTSGHEIPFWDFGVPTTQPGGKPINPSSAADIYQPATGLYARVYTKGTVLANVTASAKTYTLPVAMYDAATEVNRDGKLTRFEAGTVMTVAPYDALFLLLASGEGPQAPNPPSGLSVSATQTSLTLSWGAVTGASGYEVRINGGVPVTVAGTSHTFSGLTAGTAYTLDVRTVASSQASAWASISGTTSSGTVLGPVTGLNAINITTDSATVRWTAVPNATGYQVRVNGGTNSPVMGTQRLVTGLTAATTYNVEVRAIAGTTVGPWSSLSVTTIASAPDLALKVGGVWLLQQSTSAGSNYLTQMRTGFTTVPSAVGFGLRFPLDQVIDAAGNLITTSTGLLTRHAEAVKTINAERGRDYKLSLRPIAGQYTPPEWKNAMPAAMLFASGTQSVIHPCYNTVTTHSHDGLAEHTHQVGEPNDIYEIRWRKFLQQLVAWREDNGYQSLIPFLHGTYYSRDYSEYYYGIDLRNAATYTAANHRDAHKELATIMFEEVPEDVAVEWATTGNGPMVGTYTSGTYVPGTNPFIEDMHDHLVSLYGSGSDRVYYSFNGWDDFQVAGAISTPPGSEDYAAEYNKQLAAHHERTGYLRKELQDIAQSYNFPWTTAFKWAYGGANDLKPTYSATSWPPLRTLGKAHEGGVDRYRQNGVVPIEVYLFRAQGTTGQALYSAQLEAEAAAFRAHILANFS